MYHPSEPAAKTTQSLPPSGMAGMSLGLRDMPKAAEARHKVRKRVFMAGSLIRLRMMPWDALVSFYIENLILVVLCDEKANSV